MSRPHKIQWPIDFEALLRYMFPKKRPEERLKFYRLFWRDHMHKPSMAKASSQEIENKLIADKDKKFSENDAYHWRMWSAMSMEQWKKEHRRGRAKLMAAGKWKKYYEKKAKKPLDEVL